MKKMFFVSLAVVFAVSCSFVHFDGNKLNAEPADKVYITKTVEVEDFTALQIDIPADVKYETGDPYCHVEGADNIVNDLIFKKDGNKLRIYSDRKFKNIKKLDIRLSSSTLESLIINGAGEFECSKGFETGNFEVQGNGAVDVSIDSLVADDVKVRINGAGDVDFEEMFSKSADVQMNGAGDVSLSGNVKDVRVVINGAGEVDVTDLKYDNISAQTNGVGRIKK